MDGNTLGAIVREGKVVKWCDTLMHEGNGSELCGMVRLLRVGNRDVP